MIFEGRLTDLGLLVKGKGRQLQSRRAEPTLLALPKADYIYPLFSWRLKLIKTPLLSQDIYSSSPLFLMLHFILAP